MFQSVTVRIWATNQAPEPNKCLGGSLSYEWHSPDAS